MKRPFTEVDKPILDSSTSVTNLVRNTAKDDEKRMSLSHSDYPRIRPRTERDGRHFRMPVGPQTFFYLICDANHCHRSTNTTKLLARLLLKVAVALASRYPGESRLSVRMNVLRGFVVVRLSCSYSMTCIADIFEKLDSERDVLYLSPFMLLDPT